MFYVQRQIESGILFMVLIIYPVSFLPVLLDFSPEFSYYQFAHWFNVNSWQSFFISWHARSGDIIIILVFIRFAFSVFYGEMYHSKLYYYFWLSTFGIAMAASMSFTFLFGDERAYWSLQTISSMPVYLDKILPAKLGSQLSWIMKAGTIISAATFQRWFAFHIGYCMVLFWHGMWWKTIKKFSIFDFRFLICGMVACIISSAFAFVMPETPGNIANFMNTPIDIPVIWHQWPVFKLVAVISPLNVWLILFALIGFFIILPFIKLKKI